MLLLALLASKDIGTAATVQVVIPRGHSTFRVALPKPTVLSPLQLAFEPDADCPGGLYARVAALYQGADRWQLLAASAGFYLASNTPIAELLIGVDQGQQDFQKCILLLRSPAVADEPVEVPKIATWIDIDGTGGLAEFWRPLYLPYYAKRLELVMPMCLGVRVLSVEAFRRTERIPIARVPGALEQYELEAPKVIDSVRVIVDSSQDAPVCRIDVVIFDRAP
jgi:hypothetical protein